jgi:hypothetical protein
MIPADFRVRLEKVQAAAAEHAAMMEGKTYQDRGEWERDYAKGLDLLQQHNDILQEMSEALDAGEVELS